MNLKFKLTSRKFWAAVAEFVAMLLVFFNYPQDKTTQITALIMAGAAVIAYIVGEGLIDAVKKPSEPLPGIEVDEIRTYDDKER